MCRLVPWHGLLMECCPKVEIHRSHNQDFRWTPATWFTCWTCCCKLYNIYSSFLYFGKGGGWSQLFLNHLNEQEICDSKSYPWQSMKNYLWVSCATYWASRKWQCKTPMRYRDLRMNYWKLGDPLFYGHMHILTRSMLSECRKHSFIGGVCVHPIPVNSVNDAYRATLVFTFATFLCCIFFWG